MNREEAKTLLNEFHTPQHVQDHCYQVARVARFLAGKLSQKGIPIDPEEMEVAGILHDIVRVVDFKTLPPTLGNEEDQKFWKKIREKYRGMHHAEAAGMVLKGRGEDRLADIIKRHGYSSIGIDSGPQTWEAKVLYYADKRVAHDDVVSLEERLNEGQKRYYPDTPVTQEEMSRRQKVFALEKEIFSHLDFTPAEIR